MYKYKDIYLPDMISVMVADHPIVVCDWTTDEEIYKGLPMHFEEEEREKYSDFLVEDVSIDYYLAIIKITVTQEVKKKC